MIAKLAATLLTAAVLIAGPALAQSGHEEMTPEQKAEMEAYMKAGTPGAPHTALATTAGVYDLKIKSWHEPGGPAMEDIGTATRMMTLDGHVLVEEVSSAMMGMPFKGHGMMGFDNVSGEYWHTWADSMSTGVMLSEGKCDAQNACTFTGTFNCPIRKGPVTSRMTSRWTNPKTQIFEMYGPDRTGKEMKMMEITYNKR